MGNILLLFILVMLTPVSVHAHEDMGWVHANADGALVLFKSIQFLLPVLACALLPGPANLPRMVYSLIIVMLGILVGSSGLYMPTHVDSFVLLTRGYLVLLGLLILIDIRLPMSALITICAVTGVATGLEYRVAWFGSPMTQFPVVFGFAVASSMTVALASLLTIKFQTGWQHVAIRVAGSWITAIAIIFIAFMFKRMT